MELDRSHVLALRSAGHALGTRRPAAELVSAVAAIGLRRTKGTPLSVAARVDGVGEADVAAALGDGRLVAVFGARGTMMVVPADDVGLFTVGAAPTDEESLRHAIPGAFLRQLDKAGLSASDALAAVIDAVRDALSAGPLPRGEVAMAVTRVLPRTLTPPCRGRCPDPHVEDSLFRLAGVNGAMTFDRDSDDLISLDRTVPREQARTELVRRYLRCYGPSEPAALADWAGISPADARRSLAALNSETVEATVDGAGAGVLLKAQTKRIEDVDGGGTRFLPAFDPYLLDRDRAMLVPDRDAQRIVWRSSGNPGVVIVAGEPVATWRPKGKALVVQPLGPSLPVNPGDLQEEADIVATVLGKDGPVELLVEGR